MKENFYFFHGMETGRYMEPPATKVNEPFAKRFFLLGKTPDYRGLRVIIAGGRRVKLRESPLRESLHSLLLGSEIYGVTYMNMTRILDEEMYDSVTDKTILHDLIEENKKEELFFLNPIVEKYRRRPKQIKMIRYSQGIVHHKKEDYQ